MNAQPSTVSSIESPTLAGALQLGAARLSQVGIESARLDAEVLLRHVLGLEQDGLYLRLDDPLRSRDQEQFQQLLERRVAREPLAYITGHKEFWSLNFIVTPAVLIPRPETELLVELTLAYAHEYRHAVPFRILDIGTGSGAIAVSLAAHLPDAEVWATDISKAALRLAEANAQRYDLEKRMRFFHGDLFEALDPTSAMFDFIVSNPPYIRRTDLAALASEICQWEPAVALDGGTDGLKLYRRIIGAAPSRLAEGGRLLLEIGSDQAQAVVGISVGAGCYLPASIHRDYAGRDRVVAAMKGAGRG